MSEWNVIFTGQAESDLRGIYEYICFTLLEPETAAKLTRRIIDKTSKLKDSPESCTLYHKEPWKSRGLRRTNEKNYAIFFAPVKNECKVVILRILYGGRDIERIIDETPRI